MTGIVLDAILMLLLVAALGYGVRLEKKLRTLRDGQLAFAGAVAELNQAAGRAEAALASLREASQETDMLHDRIVKAREVKQQLEVLMVRAPVREAAPAPVPVAPAAPVPAPAPVVDDEAGDRARRMASLLERIGGAAEQAPRENVERLAPVLQALAANQAAQQSLNRARRSLDTDLFAA
ncbi:MAG: DUF6468 domain-containing protein [Pseudomonadota bacterium]